MVRVEKDRVQLLLHWRGGDHTEVFVGKRATGRHRYTTDAETETETLITGLARQMPDMAIAALLNRLGRRTSKGNSWKESNVRSFRNKRGIPVYREGEQRARNEMTLSEAAATLQINPQKARRLIKNGDLPARQLCKGAPGSSPRPMSTACVQDSDRKHPNCHLSDDSPQNREPRILDKNGSVTRMPRNTIYGGTQYTQYQRRTEVCIMKQRSLRRHHCDDGLTQPRGRLRPEVAHPPRSHRLYGSRDIATRRYDVKDDPTQPSRVFWAN